MESFVPKWVESSFPYPTSEVSDGRSDLWTGAFVVEWTTPHIWRTGERSGYVSLRVISRMTSAVHRSFAPNEMGGWIGWVEAGQEICVSELVLSHVDRPECTSGSPTPNRFACHRGNLADQKCRL